MENKPYTYEDGYLPGREYTSEDIQDLPPDYEDQVYSPLELEELDKFTHIHEQIDQVEENLTKNIGYFNGVVEGQPPKRENLIFMMDSRLNWFLHEMAYHMYNGHDIVDEETGAVTRVPGFIDSPKMKEAADEFLTGRRVDKQMSEEFEKHELDNMWDNQ